MSELTLEELDKMIKEANEELGRCPYTFGERYEKASKEFTRLTTIRFEKTHNIPPGFLEGSK